MKFLPKALTLAVIIYSTGSLQAKAQQTVALKPDHITSVAHVDVIPQYGVPAAGLLKEYRTQTVKEKGLITCLILQEAGRGNHYTIVEEWADQATLDGHVGSEASRRFREKIQPMLGAPLDERLHKEME